MSAVGECNSREFSCGWSARPCQWRSRPSSRLMLAAGGYRRGHLTAPDFFLLAKTPRAGFGARPVVIQVSGGACSPGGDDSGLEAIFQTEVHALNPEIRIVEREGRIRVADQRLRNRRGRELAGVEGGIDLVAGADNVRPVEPGVADSGAELGGDLVADVDAEL